MLVHFKRKRNQPHSVVVWYMYNILLCNIIIHQAKLLRNHFCFVGFPSLQITLRKTCERTSGRELFVSFIVSSKVGDFKSNSLRDPDAHNVENWSCMKGVYINMQHVCHIQYIYHIKQLQDIITIPMGFWLKDQGLESTHLENKIKDFHRIYRYV